MNSLKAIIQSIKHIVIGKARNPEDKELFHKLSLIAFFAWIGLGADGLSSSCYGPEEAFRALGTHIHLGILIALATALTIIVIGISYSQIIELFPSGGGGYVVASKLLSPRIGMVSGCALLIDYVLTIVVSVSSGADAIFSFLPPSLYPYKIYVAVALLLLLIILNLRGVKESVTILAPIFLLFIVTHIFVIVYGLALHTNTMSSSAAATVHDMHATYSSLGLIGMLMLLVRAYSMGAGTYTGIEAVSNGLPMLREPKVKTAKRTMRYMMISLAFTALGIMVAYTLYKVAPQTGRTLNAVLFESITAAWNNDIARVFIFITLASEAALLFVAAQTGFLSGPSVLANMALDRWFPTRFAMLSDRFVAKNGIIMIGIAALILMLATHGSLAILIVLYSINVFITFLFSQLGMVRYWISHRAIVPQWKKKLFINGTGLVMTVLILISIIVIKFNEGGWITLCITSILVLVAVFIKRHYLKTAKMLRRLNNLVEIVSREAQQGPHTYDIVCNPKEKTAVLLVNGFNGLGLHTLFTLFKLFGPMYKNFVFVCVGVIDAGVFKSKGEMDKLREQLQDELHKYVAYVERQGMYAESVVVLGIDVIEKTDSVATHLMKQYPNSVFFGGQIVFPEETFITKLLHNYTVFAVQRSLYSRGIPFVILPIRI